MTKNPARTTSPALAHAIPSPCKNTCCRSLGHVEPTRNFTAPSLRNIEATQGKTCAMREARSSSSPEAAAISFTYSRYGYVHWIALHPADDHGNHHPPVWYWMSHRIMLEESTSPKACLSTISLQMIYNRAYEDKHYSRYRAWKRMIMMLDSRFRRRIRKGACSFSQPWSPRTADEMAKILAINVERLAILAHNAAILCDVSAPIPTVPASRAVGREQSQLQSQLFRLSYMTSAFCTLPHSLSSKSVLLALPLTGQ
jgi:hypothetical protein